LLHRGTEKLIEYRTYNQSIPYFNRLDYCSFIAQEEIYCYGIEKALQKFVSINMYAIVIKTMLLEISRILNHLLAITTHAMDIGAFTPFLYAFEEREYLLKLIGFFARSYHSAFIRVGGISCDLPL